MITEEIRIIPEFTGQTSASTVQSDLKFRSGYFVYTSEFGGNLVDEFTVRDFLDNSNNEQLATDFFNYLQSNYSAPDFNELYYNNLKLANVLNDYYDRTIRSNLKPTKTVANLQLTATTAVTYTNTNFIDYNKRSNEKITVVMGYNTGDSYYLNVPIPRNYSILDNQNYDKYRKNSIGNLTTKEVAEEFRYVIKKGEKIINENMVVTTNSFDDYNPKLPIGLNVPQIKIQFKKDKHIIATNTQVTTIPVEIVFDKVAQFTGQTFQLKIDYANGTDAVNALISALLVAFGGSALPNKPPLLGSEIALVDGQNNSLTSQNILISLGQSAFTANLEIKDARILLMPDLDIKLSLYYVTSQSTRGYSVSDAPFSIFTEQLKEIEVETTQSFDYVKKKNKTSPQLLLQSFVDLSFDDSESAFWLNPPTTGFPAGFTVATAPVPPPPPAPKTGNTLAGAGPVDLTKNSLYNIMINLGYTLTKRENIGGGTITMDGNNGNVKSKLILGTGGSQQQQSNKISLFHIKGYNLIKFDVNDVGETNRITGLLRDFFAPYPI